MPLSHPRPFHPWSRSAVALFGLVLIATSANSQDAAQPGDPERLGATGPAIENSLAPHLKPVPPPAPAGPEAAFVVIEVPIVMTNLDVGHAGTYARPHGGETIK